MKLEKQKELMEKLEEELKSKYDNEQVDKLLDLIYKISLIICTQRNKKEKERLLDEKSWDEKELARLNDKTNLVKELTNTKKQKAKEIKRLDKILNDKILISEEFD